MYKAATLASVIAASFICTSAKTQTLSECTYEHAAKMAGPGSDVNDPCIVHWRSIEVQKHPERARLLECMGFKAYEDPQPSGHPATLSECDRDVRADQQRLGLPVTGLSDDQRNGYYRTWGKR